MSANLYFAPVVEHGTLLCHELKYIFNEKWEMHGNDKCLLTMEHLEFLDGIRLATHTQVVKDEIKLIMDTIHKHQRVELYLRY